MTEKDREREVSEKDRGRIRGKENKTGDKESEGWRKQSTGVEAAQRVPSRIRLRPPVTAVLMVQSQSLRSETQHTSERHGGQGLEGHPEMRGLRRCGMGSEKLAVLLVKPKL